jgi:hypothetical protein
VRKKQKAGAEPSLRDRLSANLLAALEEDFRIHGVAVIEKMRETHPERYIETAAKLIMTTEPPRDGFDTAETMDDLGRKLLQSVGLPEDAATSEMIERAIEANDRLIDELSQIAAGN